ncbi:MAG: serine hydrolase [Deltaproteobacteria bacterium]|jgi:CubicO group peptidase (beta-lactamase class C family)|nr:serine hydrolase [Deltaproteobacteria bacterium]MBW2534606.1 serine hydrolase [Deltaproteobacteria bacterium]
MASRRLLATLLPLLVCLSLGCSGSDETSAPGPEGGLSTEHQQQVDELAVPLIEAGWTAGMVVGLIDASGTMEIYGYGTTDLADGSVPDEGTLFEIGSISKTFTALALALAVADGAVSLDQPVQELLPAAEVTVPTRGGASIELRHLSSHTSGLPPMPENFSPADPDDPHVDYTAADMYSFLTGYELPRDIGSEFEYSNLAVGLLGHALALEAGQPYEELIRTRISEPLGLTDTTMTLSADQEARFAAGHDADLNPIHPWHFDALAGAGALRSTAPDVLRYAASQAGTLPSDLHTAMQTTHAEQFNISLGWKVGLGWFIALDRYRWHNGATGGFGTFVAFDPQTGVGVTVLCNAVGVVYGPETLLGDALIRMMAGEPYDAPALPPTLDLPVETLSQYAGTFQVSGAGTFDIALVDDHLELHLPGQPEVRMYAATDEQFYLRVAQASITFIADSTGAYDTLHYEQDGVTPFDATRVP